MTAESRRPSQAPATRPPSFIGNSKIYLKMNEKLSSPQHLDDRMKRLNVPEILVNEDLVISAKHKKNDVKSGDDSTKKKANHDNGENIFSDKKLGVDRNPIGDSSKSKLAKELKSLGPIKNIPRGRNFDGGGNKRKEGGASPSVIVLLIYDAFDIGFMTTNDFANADIFEETYPTIAKRLREDWSSKHAIPVITVTTLGRGGSDLTATTIGKALGLNDIQVWKDVDGVLTCDPNIHSQVGVIITSDKKPEI
ncbi:Aspartokinase 2, chloroplastic [Dendrobium catenatum]|uniref:Aspartokinase 2, chloroplastic n=1 Tax=Dendrobium catenatum TaxID=906689 RepID=A0A2I0VZD1_9ASPA|nr:Aspartokinase 2, chloroplastic [Dendrobium catenatum]